jgi:TatD DNase family protein
MSQAQHLARDPAAVAVGEIGLDYRRMRSPKPAQVSLFYDMLSIASEVGLPVVIHDGQAHADVREAVSARRSRLTGGVIHCFSGDWNLARTYLDWGFFLSIPGSVTLPRFRQMREVAAKIPINRLLVETDAPHLTPSPVGKRRNEPAFLLHTAQEVAQLRGLSFSDLARAVTANAARALNLPPV